MAQTGTRSRIGVLFLASWVQACAGAHMEHGAAGTMQEGTAGTGGAPANAGAVATAGAVAMAGKSAAGGGVAAAGGVVAAAGKGAAGTKSCEREPAQHRASAAMCDNSRSASEMPQSSVGAFTCMLDADCTMGKNGRCTHGNRDTWYCTYDECFADADCKSGPCICGSDGYANNNCMAGNCQTDADCGANGYCSPSFGACGAYSGVEAYYCHTCKDECVDDADCAGMGGGDCRYEPSVGYWRCVLGGCVG